jgi:hypothetical protein
MTDDLVVRMEDGTKLSFSEFLTLCCERRAAEAKAEEALREVAQQLLNAEKTE